jgi:hypothetical protein
MGAGAVQPGYSVNTGTVPAALYRFRGSTGLGRLLSAQTDKEKDILEMGDRLTITGCQDPQDESSHEWLENMRGILVHEDAWRYFVAEDTTGTVEVFDRFRHHECLVESKTGINLKTHDWLKIKGGTFGVLLRFEVQAMSVAAPEQVGSFLIALEGSPQTQHLFKGADLVKPFEMGARLDITCMEGKPSGVLVDDNLQSFSVALDATGKMVTLDKHKVFQEKCFVKRGTVLKIDDPVKITGTAGTNFEAKFEGKVGAWAGYNSQEEGFNIDFGSQLYVIRGAYLVKDEGKKADKDTQATFDFDIKKGNTFPA